MYLAMRGGPPCPESDTLSKALSEIFPKPADVYG